MWEFNFGQNHDFPLSSPTFFGDLATEVFIFSSFGVLKTKKQAMVAVAFLNMGRGEIGLILVSDMGWIARVDPKFIVSNLWEVLDILLWRTKALAPVGTVMEGALIGVREEVKESNPLPFHGKMNGGGATEVGF